MINSNRYTRTSLFAHLVVAGVWIAAAVGPSAAWQVQIDGSDSEEGLGDVANALVVDPNGDAVAAGQLESESSLDFLVTKLSSTTGAERWRKLVPGGYALALALDPASNVVAAGSLNFAGFFAVGAFGVMKLGREGGSEIWRAEVAGDGHGEARALALDGSANVIAGGQLAKGVLPNGRPNPQFAAVKLLGATGDEVWRYTTDGSSTSGGRSDGVNALALDDAGHVIAGGELRNADGNQDFLVVKLDGSSGTELWRYEIDSGTSFGDEANTVAVDAAGDVFAAGSFGVANNAHQFFVVKLDGTSGTELWHYVVGGIATDIARQLALDAAQDVIVAGHGGPNAAFDFSVVKLSNASGAELWRRDIDSGGSDEAVAMALDPQGNVLAGGHFVVDNRDFAMVALSGATGEVAWGRALRGAETDGMDEATAVAIDAEGNALGAGFVDGFIGFEFDRIRRDFAVVKLNGADGSDFCEPDLEVFPPTGPMASTTGFDLTLLVSTCPEGPSPTGITAELDGADVTGAILACAEGEGGVGELLSGGTTLRCPGLTGGAEGSYRLSVTLDLEDGSKRTREVVWQVRGNSEP